MGKSQKLLITNQQRKRIARPLTGILHRCYHQLETVRIRSPAIGHVLQRYEVRARQYRVHSVLCVPTGDVNLQIKFT